MDAFHRSASSRTLSALSPSSKPMYIPSKGHRTRDHSSGRRHADVPPAVAALLAVTSIPLPRRKKGSRRQKPVDVFDPSPVSLPSSLASSSAFDDDFLSADLPRALSNSALSALLLSPPEYDDAVSMERSGSEGLSSVRSTSTESVPSLETDDDTLSVCSSITPSASHRRANSDPRMRIVPSPPENCVSDHPLMFEADEESSKPDVDPDVPFLQEGALKRVSLRLNLKSNLTASIRVLKSAAKSFSSLSASAAALQPDDYLTRSILSITPQYRDEKRPLPCEHEPTPALRRYLNPWRSNASFHDDSPPCMGAIQMQTYKSSHPDDVLHAAQLACGPVMRQREVRENPDFLRVIVLEMNMRRGGKLSDQAQGRARLVLPPRQPYKVRAVTDPTRWEALVCVYEA